MPQYLGIMSGTSVDAIDIALCDITHEPEWQINLLAYREYPFPAQLVLEIKALFHPGENEINRLGSVHRQLGNCYAECVKAFLQDFQLNKDKICGIGLHGQTVRHQPESPLPFSLQIGDAHTLASSIALPVIYDFRSKDIALGGQGAPLVPPFHQALLPQSEQPRIVLNLGGIANVTIIEGEHILGFDIGPANALLDAWFCAHHPESQFEASYDKDGVWAATGNTIEDLLTALMATPYLHQPAPKSTGKELFNLAWLKTHLTGDEAPNDVQATLLAFTVKAIVQVITPWLKPDVTLHICGGGAHNSALLQALHHAVATHGVSLKIMPNSDAIEAMAFAWLAYCYDATLDSNCPSVTGASQRTVLGTRVLP